jgi:DNA-binding transcriptional LysR family regulator
MINFTFMNLLPFFWVIVPTSAFQDDLLRYDDAYAPGADIVHPEGLGEAAERLGDGPFPYYLFSNMQVIGGILIFSAVLVAAVLYLRRRWVLPFGSLTLMFSVLALLFPFFTAFRHPEFIATLVAAGIGADLLARWLVAGDEPSVWRLRLFGTLLPPVVWACYLLTIELASGLGWNATVWTGIISTTAGVGYGISLIVFPPALPQPPAVEGA